jgi:class 3 adenylate cyclase/tetratricopeptide (TPR) repeat protein
VIGDHVGVICSNCGAENRADRRFCLQCGTALAQGCPNCGATNEPEARFCGNCGRALGGEATAGQPTTSPQSTRTGQPAANASSPAANASAQAAGAPSPAAERRLVTVLFADLVGFTPFAEERDAEEVRDTLQRYFDLARDVIERYGGTVEKFIGDAVMAVWGTPVAHEDDAERAVRAGLDLVDVIQTLGPGIQARAGILSGEAAVSVGATDQGLLAGDIVNTAARLQSVAPAGNVLVGESTMRAAQAALAFETVGEQALKGKQSPIPAWRALRVVAQRRGAGRSDTLETPFVGRQEEFRQLRELLHLGARDPRPRLVSITGPAGIGKSRLAWELEKYIDGVVEPIYWHRGRCPSYGEGITFWALGEMVRGRARLAEGDDAETTRQRLSAIVDDYISDPSERVWILASLLALLGLEPAPQGGREMLFAAWRRFFENVGARGTTVLVFEDLHWADGGLLDFIDHLLDWSKSTPLLIVTLARPELFDKRPDWGANRRNYTAMALDPLANDEMAELLEAIVPELETDAKRTIIARADGIPLYAVETVRMLLADGRLEEVDGSCRPTRALGELAVPDSLRSLITARLDDLPSGDKAALQDAAVLGQAFTLDALAAVHGAALDELGDRLRQLVRRELLTLEADPRSPERGQYAFMQSLTQEVAYSTLARPERRARHLAAARHFESIGGDELAGMLAGHYVAAYEASAPGEEADAVAAQARVALRAAAERASGLGSHQQAADFLEQALSVTNEPGERAQLLTRQAHEADLAGRYERAEASARSAVEIYEGLGDTAGAAGARAVLGTVLIHAQRIRDAIAELELASTQLPDDAEPTVRADVLAKLARAYYRNLEPQRALETADQALIVAEEHGLLQTAADALVSKGTALTMLNRRQESVALLRGGSELARRVGDIPTALRGEANLATIIGPILGYEESVRISRSGLELARTVGDLGMIVWQMGHIAAGAVWTGLPLEPVLAEADEVFNLALADTDRHQLEQTYMGPAMFSGRDVGQRVDDWIRRTQEIGDPQALAAAHNMRGLWAIVRGAYAEASRHQEAWSRARPEYATGTFGSLLAVMGDEPERARDLLASDLERPATLPNDRAFRSATRAGLAALEGRTGEAVHGYREALRELDGIQARFEAGIISLAMLRSLGPENPDARQAGEDALRTFEHMGAEPMIRQVREALGQPAPAAGSGEQVGETVGQAVV